MIRALFVLTSFGLLVSCGPDGMMMAPATPAAAPTAPAPSMTLGDFMTGGTASTSTPAPATGY